MRLKSEQSNNDEQLNITPILFNVGVGHEVWRLKIFMVTHAFSLLVYQGK